MELQVEFVVAARSDPVEHLAIAEVIDMIHDVVHVEAVSKPFCFDCDGSGALEAVPLHSKAWCTCC